ncbi:hypothetical protein MPER_04100, partial [Moniliophthora perniciosa FA553]
MDGYYDIVSISKVSQSRPNCEPKQSILNGRGGAGNIRSPSREPRTESAARPDYKEQEVIRNEADKNAVVEPLNANFLMRLLMFIVPEGVVAATSMKEMPRRSKEFPGNANVDLSGV